MSFLYSNRPEIFRCFGNVVSALWILCCFPLALFAQPTGNPPFELKDGDRVVLLGDTLIEREQAYGYLEARLTAEFSDRNVIFRNLGWSADTPAGESRASFDFDKPGKGFEKLKEQVSAVSPTVVILGYGMANSFDGEKGLAKFRADFERLLDALPSMSTSGPVRVVILSPIRHEFLPPPLPNPTQHNRQLELYAGALKAIAAERSLTFISLADLTSPTTHSQHSGNLTDNGIHLAASGYQSAANAVARGLGWPTESWSVAIDGHGRAAEAHGAKVSGLQVNGDGLMFSAVDDQVFGTGVALPVRLLQVTGLGAGRYQLKIDGKFVAEGSESEWRRGVAISRGPQLDQAEELRQSILKKNVLYFDRWRPQNETYLFGFRKHEQGQNAKEIPMFDPLVEKEEASIAQLRRPVAHSYELARAGQPGVVGKTGDEKAGAAAADKSARPETEPLPTFETAPGFKVNLYAQSPLLAKPTQMNFDPQGRLWVASSSVYPQILPGQVADDKILVLEDTNDDGYAEKSTVFADGLLIPTGVEPGNGGVYVGQSTELLFFKDTNGDGKADQKRVVLSGFGTEDTHHIVHTLHWGQDGQLYFNQSIYIHTHIETPNGVERLNSGGVWHLRPGSLELGVFLRGFCNPWGHQEDIFGQSFVTDGAGSQGLSYGLPGATFFTYANMRRELKSVSAGNYPKFCALELIRSEQFPPEWQGNAITCDFRAHRVVRFGIEEQGAGYVARELGDLVRSTNVSFRPIDVKLGPDGALYIADWSNPIIQHGEVDFRDPRRDHEHGRIWRVTAEGRPVLKRPHLVQATNRELLDQLLSPNAWNQQQARRVLTERGKAIERDLAAWTKTQNSETALLQALWMYQSIDHVQPALIQRLLNASDGHVRAAAVRVLSYWQPRMKNSADLLARRVQDDFPRARLEAVRALAVAPSARSAELVLSALDRPMDSFLDYAVWLSINDLAKPWIQAVKSGAWRADGREKQLEFALKALEPAQAGEVLDLELKGRTISRDGSGPWIDLIGAGGGPALLARIYEQALTGGFDDAGTARVLNALAVAARERKVKPAEKQDELSTLLTSKSPEVQEAAMRLAGAWRLRKTVPSLLRVAGDKSSSGAVRSAAFEGLRDVGGNDVNTGLETMIEHGENDAIRRQAALTLASLNLRRAAQAASPLLVATIDDADSIEFWRSFLHVKGAGSALAVALPKTGIPGSAAKVGLRVAREGGRNEPDLVWALARGANLESESEALSAEEMKKLAEDASAEGRAARGERVFRRKELSCVTCHAIGGVGGKVGPDLTSIGASAQMDYLIESVLYPNRKIKEGYHTILIETKDGLEYAGVLVREDTERLVLRDATDKETSLLKIDIKSRATGNSLMPAGLVDPLNRGERLDLFRFLSELGKPGSFDASRGDVARAWRLMPETIDMAQFGDEKSLKIRLTDPKWSLGRSLVDGRLLKEDLSEAIKEKKSRDPKAVFAAAQFQVAKAGPIHFKLAGLDGSAAWIDGQSVPAGSELESSLAAGTHTLVFKIDASKLPDSIKASSPDATFLTAAVDE
jgi:putative heme-binding domain-containing protein